MMNYPSQGEAYPSQKDAYYSILRQVMSEEFGAVSDETIAFEFENLMASVPEDEAEEFITSLIGAAAPSIISGIGGLFGGKGGGGSGGIFSSVLSGLGGVFGGGSRPRSRPKTQRPPQLNAMQDMAKMFRDPQFMSTFFGQFLNSLTGSQAGKKANRRSVRSRSGRESIEMVRFEDYMEKLAQLALQAAGKGEAGLQADSESFSFDPMDDEIQFYENRYPGGY